MMNFNSPNESARAAWCLSVGLLHVLLEKRQITKDDALKALQVAEGLLAGDMTVGSVEAHKFLTKQRADFGKSWPGSE